MQSRESIDNNLYLHHFLRYFYDDWIILSGFVFGLYPQSLVDPLYSLPHDHAYRQPRPDRPLRPLPKKRTPIERRIEKVRRAQ